MSSLLSSCVVGLVDLRAAARSSRCRSLLHCGASVASDSVSKHAVGQRPSVGVSKSASVALDERIANFPQQLDLLGWRRWRRRLLAFQLIDLIYHQKDDEGEDDEIDRHGDEIPVRQQWHA